MVLDGGVLGAWVPRRPGHAHSSHDFLSRVDELRALAARRPNSSTGRGRGSRNGSRGALDPGANLRESRGLSPASDRMRRASGASTEPA
jgi:hypothetical protein